MKLYMVPTSSRLVMDPGKYISLDRHTTVRLDPGTNCFCVICHIVHATVLRPKIDGYPCFTNSKWRFPCSSAQCAARLRLRRQKQKQKQSLLRVESATLICGCIRPDLVIYFVCQEGCYDRGGEEGGEEENWLCVCF